ncbi:MAG: penicillin-binding protein activator [Gammaproteobacteria bacterium]|nr:penicillin-binding protein activator [Pseudomonadales bacterium]MCP5345553.1 penicillin-binding protein activator [Pseudomonadales bacterium]
MIALRNGRKPLPGLLLTLLLLSACNVAEQPTELPPDPEVVTPRSAEGFLELAELSDQPQADEYRVTAAELLLQEQRLDRAREVLAEIRQGRDLNTQMQVRLALVRAELALDSGNPQLALGTLDSELTSGLSRQPPAIRLQFNELRAQALMATGRFGESVLTLAEFDGNRQREQIRHTHDLIWQALQQLTDPELTTLADQAGTYQLRGWVELARAMRSREYSIPSQLAALERWQSVWNRHEAADLLPVALQQLAAAWERRPRHIALLLPLQDQIGRAVQEGFLSAYYQALETDGEVPEISVFNTSGSSGIQGLYRAAVESGADLVIGPLNKDLVRQLDDQPALPVPALALNYTDYPTRNIESLFQFGLAPEDEIRRAAAQAWQAGLRNAAMIAPDSTDYERLKQAFDDTWRNLGGHVVSTVNYSDGGDYGDTVKRLLAINASEARAARIQALLPRDEIQFVPIRRSDIDFIFLMANARQGRQIKPTLAFYFAENIPVYALPSIYDGSNNQLANQDLNGIIFTDAPWLLEQSPLKESIAGSLRPAQGALQRLRALGVDSFRLYARLGQLADGEVVNLRGATGVLSMNGSGVIQRIPQTAVFVDGKAILLDQGQGQDPN